MRTFSLALLAAALPVDALACGGFFCDNQFPIDQAAEDIVFGVDTGSGTTTVHVEVSYEGASDDFAWVVPVPAVPDLEISSDALFTALGNATAPRFFLNFETNGICDWGIGRSEDLMSVDMDVAEDGGGVTVVGQSQVGPYDTVTLQADSSAELLTWLNAAGYDLPSDLDPALAPYVAGGQYFVALKLSAGNDTGDLAPIALTYDGTAPVIPIQLTSVAATPDMRLRVFVLGDERAVPDNYLHVTINEAAIDWFNQGSNYQEVISLAADEAGGQAFATDFSGSLQPLRGTLYQPGWYDLDGLSEANGPIDWMDRLMGSGLPPSAALMDVLQAVIPYPDALAVQGVSEQDFYNCLACYPEYIDAESFDAQVATDTLQTQVLDGLIAAEDLFSRFDHLTRLTSSMDAIEMTMDPMFVFNGDLPQQVDNVHTATVTSNCGLGESIDTAERVLTLADGREIRLPSTNWMQRNDTNEYDTMGDLTSPAAILIEDVGASGAGEVVFDFRDEAEVEARRFNRPGCACDAGSSSGGALWVLGLAALGLRRRRSA